MEVLSVSGHPYRRGCTLDIYRQMDRYTDRWTDIGTDGQI